MVICINVCVACLTSKTTILPWNIVSASYREHSFLRFLWFLHPVAYFLRILTTWFMLSWAPPKKMDRVDLDLPVVTVVELCGRFLKYLVEQKQKEGESCSSTASTSRNAFDVLMSSQQALQHSRMLRQLPEPVDERNKDKLCCCSWNRKISN